MSAHATTTLISKIMIVVAIIRPSLSVRFALVQVFIRLFIILLFKCVSVVITTNIVIIYILSIGYRVTLVRKIGKGKKFRRKKRKKRGPGVNETGFFFGSGGIYLDPIQTFPTSNIFPKTVTLGTYIYIVVP